MNRLRFLGDSLKCLREFPENVRHDAGRPLDKVRGGEQPDDFKPMPAAAKASRKSGCGTTPAPTGWS